MIERRDMLKALAVITLPATSLPLVIGAATPCSYMGVPSLPKLPTRAWAAHPLLTPERQRFFQTLAATGRQGTSNLALFACFAGIKHWWCVEARATGLRADPASWQLLVRQMNILEMTCVSEEQKRRPVGVSVGVDGQLTVRGYIYRPGMEWHISVCQSHTQDGIACGCSLA